MESNKRSFLKAVTWRVLASIITGTVVFCFTRKELLAFSVGICDSLVKILGYFLHERLWASIPYGVRPHPLQRFDLVKPLAAEHEKVIRQKLNELGYLANENP